MTGRRRRGVGDRVTRAQSQGVIASPHRTAERRLRLTPRWPLTLGWR